MATGNLKELLFSLSVSAYNGRISDADWANIQAAMDAAYGGNVWSEPVADQVIGQVRNYLEKLLALAGEKADGVTWTDDDDPGDPAGGPAYDPLLDA